MAIIKELTFYDFAQAFENHNRQNQFTRAGLSALYDYLEEYSEELGDDLELDVIALCCEFTEYKTIKDALEEYNFTSIQELTDNTFILHTNDGGIIVQDF